MPVGIEVFGDAGNFQFGSVYRGMKVVKRLIISPTNIITDDTGNSIVPDFYYANHWWSQEPIFSQDAVIAVRPLTKNADFYAHYARGRRAWFNTPSAPSSATFSIFVSRPCEVYIYDYPSPPPASMAGFVVYDELGRPTFSSDGIHMRIAAQMSGQLPLVTPGIPGVSLPEYGTATITLPPNDYSICPLVRPYQNALTDVYVVGGITLYDYEFCNSWYNVTDTQIRVFLKKSFQTGLSQESYPEYLDFPFNGLLVLYTNWEQSISPG